MFAAVNSRIGISSHFLNACFDIFTAEDDLMVVDDVDIIKSGTKRKADPESDDMGAKRMKSSGDQGDIVIL